MVLQGIKADIREAVMEGLSADPDPEGVRRIRQGCGLAVSLARDGSSLRLVWGLPGKGVNRISVDGDVPDRETELLPQAAPVFRALARRLRLASEKAGAPLETFVGKPLAELCSVLGSLPEKPPAETCKTFQPSVSSAGPFNKRRSKNRKGARK